MKTFKNSNFTKRNYKCTNIVFCQGNILPTWDGIEWNECDEQELKASGCEQLWRQNDVAYFGWL